MPTLQKLLTLPPQSDMTPPPLEFPLYYNIY